MGDTTLELNKYAVIYLGTELVGLYDVDYFDNLAVWQILQDQKPECCQLITDLRRVWSDSPTLYFIDSAVKMHELREIFTEHPLEMYQMVLETGNKIV